MMNPDKPHDMLMNHVSFNVKVKKTLPSDAIWFTILRQPLSYYASAYGYLLFDKITNVSFQEFIASPQTYLSKIDTGSSSSFHRSLGRALLQQELGFGTHTHINGTTLIKTLKENFNFVMVLSHFDHGLCLLRRKLCWTFEDILYVKQNQRAKTEQFSPEQKKLYYENLKAVIPDYIQVYEHFYKAFQKLIDKELENDVKYFQYLLAQTEDECQFESTSGKAETNSLFMPRYQPTDLLASTVRYAG